MSVFKKALTGFNHNIKHKGRHYHVQTEDSGVNNPHIITHLFVGGNILASKKTSYADIVNAENLAQVVRELMEEQHKEMLRNLLNGVYDDVDNTAGAQGVKSYAPGQIHTDSGQVTMNVGSAIMQATAGAAAPVPAPAPVAAAPKPIPLVAPAAALSSAAAAQAHELRPEVLAARELKGLKPKEGGETLFGEDLISEKSLDEVILAYLAGESK